MKANHKTADQFAVDLVGVSLASAGQVYELVQVCAIRAQVRAEISCLAVGQKLFNLELELKMFAGLMSR